MSNKIPTNPISNVEYNIGYRLSLIIGDVEKYGDANGLTPLEVSHLARKLRDYHDEILDEKYRAPYSPHRIDKHYRSIIDKSAPKDKF